MTDDEQDTETEDEMEWAESAMDDTDDPVEREDPAADDDAESDSGGPDGPPDVDGTDAEDPILDDGPADDPAVTDDKAFTMEWEDDPAVTNDEAFTVDEANDTALTDDESFAGTEGADNAALPGDETFDEMEGAFEEMDIEDVDADEVWADVADDEGAEMEEPGVPDERADEENTVEVSKHDYCETCEYLSQAPEIHCTHEGTEILEFTGMDNVRVANCPIVAEREGLEQGVSQGGTDFGEIQRD
jgi:hypothetical protein